VRPRQIIVVTSIQWERDPVAEHVMHQRQAAASPAPPRPAAEPVSGRAASQQFICNAVPVGVGGFALTTFTLGLYTSGQLNSKGEVLVLALALMYGGLTQFIAGFFALRRGDLFPAAFMTSYGAFWFSFVGVITYVVPHAGSAAPQAVTTFLCMWTVITLIFTVATLGTNWTVFLTFLVFDVAIILEDIGNGAGSKGLIHLGGYFEMLLAAMAWYIVLAEIVNETLKKEIFPLFPFKHALIGSAA
jgi:succinate-acetate transporter protein